MRHLISNFIAGVLLLPSPAFASDWLLVSEGSTGGRAWIDRESVSKVDQQVTLWMKVGFEKHESDGAVTTVSYLTIDCNRSMYDLKHYIRSGAGGEVIVNRSVYFRRWDPIPPDSHIYLVFKSACAL